MLKVLRTESFCLYWHFIYNNYINTTKIKTLIKIKVMLQEIKKEQKALIESMCTPEPWVKQEIITIVDEQISAIPELDRNRYIYAIKSMEHPEGFVLNMDVHPCLRIREGVIVRDSGNNPEGFFWPDSFYQKMNKKTKKN